MTMTDTLVQLSPSRFAALDFRVKLVGLLLASTLIFVWNNLFAQALLLATVVALMLAARTPAADALAARPAHSAGAGSDLRDPGPVEPLWHSSRLHCAGRRSIPRRRACVHGGGARLRSCRRLPHSGAAARIPARIFHDGTQRHRSGPHAAARALPRRAAVLDHISFRASAAGGVPVDQGRPAPERHRSRQLRHTAQAPRHGADAGGR